MEGNTKSREPADSGDRLADQVGRTRLRDPWWERYQGPRSLGRLTELIFASIGLMWQAAPRLVLAFAGLQVMEAVATGVSLLAVRQVVSGLLAASQANAGVGAVVPGLVILAGAFVITGFSGSLQGSVTWILSELVEWHAAERVLDVACAVELEAFDRPAFFDRLQRARNAGSRPFQMTNSLLSITRSLTTVAGVLAVLAVLQPVLIPILLLSVVPLLLTSRSASREYYEMMSALIQSEMMRNYVSGLLSERDMAKEVRGFGLVRRLRAVNRTLFERRLRELRRLMRRRSTRSLLGNLGSATGVVTAVVLLLYLVLSHQVTLAGASAGAMAIITVGEQLQTLAFGIGQIYESSLFLEDYRTFYGMLPELQASRPSEPAPEGFDEITVEGVSFTYPESERRALADVSLRLRRGEVVALVGENGSGKTTLAKLLGRLYSPQEGRVCWDGVDIRAVDGERLRRSVAVLFQDFARYLFTAGVNVGLGRVERLEDDRAVELAARRAGAHEFIEQLPEGYHTIMSKQFVGGADLSIGQWQRLAIARAFFRDAPFIILDEPTAALDARAEHELFARMRELFQGRTVLLISHRFSSVLSADRIYVMKEGRIAEQGTHAELMARQGLYAELFTLQAAAYQREILR